MNQFQGFSRAGKSKSKTGSGNRVLVTKECLIAIQGGLGREMQIGHEGILYLLGRTDGTNTLITSVYRPKAKTGVGYFEVSSVEMANIVRTAVKRGLQVVGQVHTHPKKAFHSKGDEEGARIRYSGFVSIVLPEYGRHLPDLSEAAVFMFAKSSGFVDIGIENVMIVPERIE